MVLSDKDISAYLKSGLLKIFPMPEEIGTASIDLRLGSSFLKVDEQSTPIIDVERQISYTTHTHDCYVIIPPQTFILGSTKERIVLPGILSAYIEGRSSVGRLGIFVQNAGYIDPGFDGKITIELFNANKLPVKLNVGMRICQLVLLKTSSEVSNLYCGKYQNQDNVTGSKIFIETEVK